MFVLKYWIWLSELKGITNVTRLRLLEQFGNPETIYRTDEKVFYKMKKIDQRQIPYLQDHDLTHADKILSDCTRLGIRILTKQDVCYPERLNNIYDPPCLLYVRGRLPSTDESLTVSVVGTRRCSPYGISAANKLSFGLASHRTIIISGLATGIDTAAVEGALRAGSPVIGVLGNGIDVYYPKSNRELYEDVVAGGALISEYPPGITPLPAHFPARNRIMSGLSVAVLVVEAPLHSGALITASLALEQGRDVFAVPGPIDAPTWKGSNRLIRDGAGLVAEPWDLLREYNSLYPEISEQNQKAIPMTQPIQSTETEEEPSLSVPQKSTKDTKPPSTVQNDLTDTDAAPQEDPESVAKLPTVQLSTLNLTEDQIVLLQALTEEPRDVDDLIDQTDIPANRVLSALTMLQIEDLAAQHNGKRYSRTVLLTD